MHETVAGSTRGARWRRRAALVAMGTLVGLLLLELVARVLDLPPRPLVQVPFRTYQLSDDPLIGYGYRPGYQPDAVPFDREHIGFAINSAGFRDDEHAIRKPAGTRRIVFVGDSTTAGNGIRERANVYTEVLERALARRAHDVRYEVMNLAVGGYHTVQEVQTLKTAGMAYDPDVVAVTICQNDFTFDGDGGVYSALMRVNARREPRARWLSALLRHSRVALIVYHGYFAEETRGLYRAWYLEHVLRGRDPVQVGMEMLRALHAETGVPVLVVVLPDFAHPLSGRPGGEMHERVLRAVGNSPGITVVDVREGFARIDENGSRFTYDNLHLNEYGHGKLADLLLPFVEAAANAAPLPR